MIKSIITLVFIIICSLSFGQVDSVNSTAKSSSGNMLEFNNEINWEGIIALCALIVSVVSIVFTIIQVKLQRIHNKKSIKPIGRIRTGDYQNNIFIKIDNNGVGPLIIKKVLIEYESLQTTQSIIEILPEDLANRITWTNFTAAYEGRAILPGQSLELIVWSINKTYDGKSNEIIESDRSDLRNVLKKFSVSVLYTDIYEREEFRHQLNQQHFFNCYGRHNGK